MNALINLADQLAEAQELQRSSRVSEAEAAYRKILDENPISGDANDAMGRFLRSLGRAEEAVVFFERAAKEYPNNVEILLRLAEALGRIGQIERCRAVYEKAVLIAPKMAAPVLAYGVFLAGCEKWEEAEKRLNAGIQLEEVSSTMLRRYADVLEKLGRLEEAEAQRSMAKAMEDGQKKSKENLERARNFHQAGSLKEALGLYEEVLRYEADSGDALHGSGVAYYTLGNYSEAERLLGRAAMILSERADVFTHWGSALQKMGKSAESIEAHEKALLLAPTSSVILSNYGNALSDAGRPDDAIFVFKRSLDAEPKNAHAWINYSQALKQTGKLIEALAAAKKGVEVGGALSGAYSNLGTIFVAIGEADLAIGQFKKARELEPKSLKVWSNLLYSMQYSDTTGSAEIARETEAFGKLFEPGVVSTREMEPREVLKIGFVSNDLRQHAVARFLKPLLSMRANGKVELYLYSDSHIEDRWSETLKLECEEWRSICGRTDEQAASVIGRDGIDILVDLGGHSAFNRLALFAMKPAPVQVTWLGFPGSTGLRAIDYRIADEIALTSEEASFFPETPLYLPSGFHSFDFSESNAVAPQPALSGKPFTFGSFNNLSKLSGKNISLWAAILKKAPHSRLALKAYQLRDSAFKEYLLAKFVALGVDASRIVLLDPVLDYGGHLDCYAQVDLCLDTYPYNGTTTTCEAMSMGVPTITLLGDRVCSRMGASLLTEVGLDSFICESEKEYISAAVSWAARPQELSVLRERLRGEMKHSSLGDGSRFAKAFFGALHGAYRETLALKKPSDRGERKSMISDWIEKIEFPFHSTDGDLLHKGLDAHLPGDVSGMRVLDASCVDGYWALEMLRRGAKQVVAIPAEGLYSTNEDGSIHPVRREHFESGRELEGLGNESMALLPSQVYMINPELAGEFDLALLLVNVNQLRHLVFALDSIRSVCRDRLILKLEVCQSDESEDEGVSAILLNEGPYWLPTIAAVTDLLKLSGFESVGRELSVSANGSHSLVVVAKAI